MSLSGGARRALLALAIVGGTAAWLLAASRLWRTSVPADVAPPSIAAEDFFSPALLEEAQGFQRFVDVTDILATVAMLAAVGVFAVVGARFTRESAAGRIGTGMLLGMLALAFVWIAQLPFGLAQLWWVRRHDLTDITYPDWLLGYWITAGGEFLFISLALLIVMAIAGAWPRRWWLAAPIVLAAVSLAFAFTQPYILPGLDEPRDPDLAGDIERLAADQGIAEPDVRVMDTYGAAESPNAIAVGIGPSERVILWDTLVGDFDRAETRVVVAHELAHLSRDHILELGAWTALLSLPVALLVALATRSRGGMREPAAVPVAVLVVAVVMVVTAPLGGEFSQRHEAEADWIALESTEDPDAAEKLFVEFTRGALLDPDPPWWSGAAIGTHPTILDRLEMTAAWREHESH